MAKKNLLRTRFDFCIRTLLAGAFALMAGLYVRNAFIYAVAHEAGKTELEVTLTSFSLMAIGLYCFMIAYLYAIRLQPINKFAGWLPAITALVGGFLIIGLTWLHPKEDLPVAFKLLSAALILIGNVLTVIALKNLGRSFSILPEGRQFVKKGPYRYVRHPVYVAEAIATLGAMITFWSWQAIALVAAQFALQLCRIHFEEKVLKATFPAYRKYCKTTARLIPGVY
jgi:protein-S-isoprenylcysteine O-methyltransferase Ste14